MQPRATSQGLTIRRCPALSSPSYAPPISCEPVPTLRHFFLLRLNAAFHLVHSSLILDRLAVNSNALIAFDLGVSRGLFKDRTLCRAALSSVCAVLKRLLSRVIFSPVDLPSDMFASSYSSFSTLDAGVLVFLTCAWHTPHHMPAQRYLFDIGTGS